MGTGGGGLSSRRGWAGVVLVVWLVLTVCLVWGFHASRPTGAGITALVVAGVLWPVPLGLAAALVDPDVVGVRSVRAIAENLLIALALAPMIALLVGIVWALYAWLWPGSPDVAPTGLLIFLLGWCAVGSVVLVAKADKSDRYSGGWAP
ncbi:hypothetical protein [Plantactinospora sonchi]|uniref:Uncharacterized protein n=1 Tax=Plantactinospora sonchi TaxID=1544735 RepID=A0ABU7RVW9_9ACTN